MHEPSIVKADDGYFYLFGSHMAAARSLDLIAWEQISRDAGAGNTLVENAREEMREALAWAKTGTFWAPDVQPLGDGRYYCYCCACVGNAPFSALGLAVSDNPQGPYMDPGVFLKSGAPGYNAYILPNEVDPHSFFDNEGRLWMVYGSYSGGSFILRMVPGTCFPPEGQGYGAKLMGGYQFDPLPGETNRRSMGFRSPGHNTACYDEETGRSFIIFHTRFAGRGRGAQRACVS